MIIGFAVKLALAPFYFWLPRVTGASGVVTSALIIGALGMAELGELSHLRASAPWVFTDYAGVWLALALFSMFAGALLALAQQDLKRMLAFSTIDDMGYLLLGVLVGSQLSLAGAVLGGASHALFKALMFGAVGVAEQGLGRPVTLDARGLAARFPISAVVFIGAALGILGVPPLFGFAGRWRLYLAGVESGGPLLGAAMAAATGLALLYYVRAIHTVWLGAPADTGETRPEAAPAEPRLAVAALGLLALAALVLGFFPALAQALI
jgi:multicomponent Na+:H+ antiporter subunit D